MVPVLTGTIQSKNVLLLQKDEQETTGREEPGFKSGFKRGLGNGVCERKQNLPSHMGLFTDSCVAKNLTFPPNLFNTKF